MTGTDLDRTGSVPQSEHLCNVCLQLGLSRAKFLPFQQTEHGGQQKTAKDSYERLKTYELGSLLEIHRKRSTCSLCWLICQAVEDNVDLTPSTDGLNPVICHAEWQLDGRFVDTPGETSPMTRRLRVFTPSSVFAEAFVMLVADEFQTHDLVEKHYTTSFLGRLIPRHHIDIDMVQRWLSICRKSHSKEDGPCGSSSPLTQTSTPDMQIWLIDLHESCLISTPLRNKEYATLSYIRESHPGLRLERSNLRDLCESGALDPYDLNILLHQTVKDTMLLTKSLGIRYLWIDTLCIMHEDQYNDTNISTLLCSVFQNGIVNICAATGDKCHAGLPGTALTARDLVQPVSSILGMKLLAVKPVEGYIQDSAWNNMTSTFQERMLARRSIIFASDRVFFQCHHATWSEEIDSDSELVSWNLDALHSPFKVFTSYKSYLHLFIECVGLYSARQSLHNWTDRLQAFASIERTIAGPLRTTFLYGLPVAYLDFGLLWDYLGPCHLIGSKPDQILPTWSWVGSAGRTTWRASLTGRCLLNLNEWLNKRTWVVYYALEGSSTTPIWPDNSWFVIQNGHAPIKRRQKTDRWKGYNSDSDGPEARRSHWTPLRSKPTKPTVTSPLPGRLYFWTYTAFFQLSVESLANPKLAARERLSPGLHRFSLLDKHGDWCGTMVLHESWLGQNDRVFEFAALSEARDFAVEELGTWTYYISEDRQDSEWDLYFALLIVWDEEHTVAERLGVAKIFQKAFDSGSYEPMKAWREIALK